MCGIDSNAHSPLWGSKDLNKRGERLEEFVFEYGLYVENLGNVPTWQCPGKGISSLIDITLSLNLEDEISHWKVSDEASFSDHKLISFIVEKPCKREILTRNYAKADWELFTSVVEKELGDPPINWSKENIENSVLNLNNTIEHGLNIACPKYPSRKRDKLDWWNHECEEAKFKYIRLERKMLRSSSGPTEEQRMAVKAARRVFKKATRRAKRDSFRNLVRETDSISAMSKLNKILDRKESSKLGMVHKVDGSMCGTTEETLKHGSDFFREMV